MKKLGMIFVVGILSCGSDDSGSTTGNETGNGSSGGDEEKAWDFCPDSNDYVGDSSWTDTLALTNEVLCWNAFENTPLQEIKSNLTKAAFTGGSYNIPPRVIATGSISLPICFNKAGEEGDKSTQTGTYNFNVVPVGEDSEAIVNIALSTDNAGQDVQIVTTDYATGVTENWIDLKVDTKLYGSGFESGRYAITYGTGYLTACEMDDNSQPIALDASFENGDSITFSFRGFAGSVKTGPSANYSVTGTVDGQAIDVDDYYSIYFNPGHHFAGGNDLAFLFDSPLRDACGIRVNGSGQNIVASLIDCDLTDISSLTVTNSTF